jgi:hypothetical protein
MFWYQLNKRRYLYKMVTEEGRARRVYLGTGAAAEVIVAADRLQRLELQRQREQLEAKQQRICETVVLIDALGRELESLARTALNATGFYLHCGKWRRRHYVQQR